MAVVYFDYSFLSQITVRDDRSKHHLVRYYGIYPISLIVMGRHSRADFWAARAN